MDLTNKTPRQLIKMKCLIGFHLKKAHPPWTIKKLKLMLEKAITLQEINKIQLGHRKEIIKKFYEVPKEHRKKNFYTTIREYNDIIETLSVNSNQTMEPTNETPVVETTPTPVEEVPATVAPEAEPSVGDAPAPEVNA